mmetsp:Transcript_10131/g.26827  ORF Transcript_10131/g.26827 Transcript_10131/m.26827 type:complete len:640 (-) Transcript_10131:69-1988(-)
MAGLTIVTLAVGDRTRRITVTGGSDVDELRALICAAFQLPATTRTAPVALIARDTNVLVPLSVACARPDSLRAPAYGVLCVGGQLLLNEPAGDLESEDDEDTETESSEEEDQQVAPATDDSRDEQLDRLVAMIVKFASMLEASGHLSRDEAAVATALAERRDTVILAAYTLAAAAQDAGYLAALIRKVARDYLTKRTDASESFDGPRDHDVAGRLLHAVDELFVTDQLSVPQCRYLQSLVLLKNPVVFAAFEVYAQDGDADELFDTLLRVAERAGRASDEAAAEASTESEEEESEEEEEEVETDESLALFRGAICREVDDLLTKGELLPKAAKAVLTALRSEGTDSASPVDRALCRLARAAYEVYRLDRDRGELRQALLDACRAYAGLDAEPEAKPAPAPAPSGAAVLRECARWLVQSKTLDEAAAANFLRLAAGGDDRVAAALARYGRGGELEEFLTSLAAIATVEEDEEEVRSPQEPSKPATNDAEALKELAELVQCLAEDGKLQGSERELVEGLVKRGDARLLAAYDVYVDSQDVDDLVDTILRVARRDAELDAQDARPPQDFASVFAEITSSNLSEVEKAALQLCAARKDADLQAVLEVYRLEGDKDDLLDSVKRIARKTIDETVAAGLPGGGDE